MLETAENLGSDTEEAPVSPGFGSRFKKLASPVLKKGLFKVWAAIEEELLLCRLGATLLFKGVTVGGGSFAWFFGERGERVGILSGGVLFSVFQL